MDMHKDMDKEEGVSIEMEKNQGEGSREREILIDR